LPESVLRSQQNCPFWTYFPKLSTEDMLVSASVDAASYFLLPISQLCWNKSFSRKAVLPRYAKRVSDSIDTAFALLASKVCHHPSGAALADARYGHPFHAALARGHQGIALGVYKPVGSTPLLLPLWGSLGELIADDDRCVSCASLPM
jgi:hypothetical protein